MSTAATANGTTRSRAIELAHLDKVVRRQQPGLPAHRRRAVVLELRRRFTRGRR